MRPTKYVLAAVALLTAGGLSSCGTGTSSTVPDGCTPRHAFPTVAPGKLTVAGYDLPPFGSRRGNEMKGVDADILAAIAKRECLTLAPKWMAPAAVIPMVQSRRADTGIPDWYRTKARAQIVALTDPMYLDQMGVASATGISTVSALKGKRVGTVDGYLWVDDLKKYLGDDLKVYPSTVNLNQDLKAGRIEAAVDSFGAARFANRDLQVKVVEPDPAVAASQEAAQASFPIPKDNPQLLAAFNENIAELAKDGTIEKILRDHGLDGSAAKVGAARLIG